MLSSEQLAAINKKLEKLSEDTHNGADIKTVWQLRENPKGYSLNNLVYYKKGLSKIVAISNGKNPESAFAELEKTLSREYSNTPELMEELYNQKITPTQFFDNAYKIISAANPTGTLDKEQAIEKVKKKSIKLN